MQALLGRKEDHIPSIDLPDDLLAERRGDLPVTEEEVRRATSYEALDPYRRAKTNANMEIIQSLCESRRVVPLNELAHKRLQAMEAAKVDTAGPGSVSILQRKPPQPSKPAKPTTGKRSAKPDGVYEMDQFMDILSSAHSSAVPADVNSIDDLHSHEKMETVCYQLAHAYPNNRDDFSTNPEYTIKLVSRNEDVLTAMMQTPQYENCEVALDKFRDSIANGKQLSGKFGEFISHFADECGLRLFCAYVVKQYKNNLFAAFEMDAVRRYFLLVAFFVDASGVDDDEVAVKVDSGTVDIMPSLVRSWNEEAMEAYHTALNNPSTAPNTYRPCTDFDLKNSAHWALYDVYKCKKIQNQRVVLQYAYYTTCQCVELK